MVDPAGMPDTVALLLPASTGLPLKPESREEALLLPPALLPARRVLPVVTKLMVSGSPVLGKLWKRAGVVPASAEVGTKPSPNMAAHSHPQARRARWMPWDDTKCGVNKSILMISTSKHLNLPGLVPWPRQYRVLPPCHGREAPLKGGLQPVTLLDLV